MARTTRKNRRLQTPKTGEHGIVYDANIGKRWFKYRHRDLNGRTRGLFARERTFDKVCLAGARERGLLLATRQDMMRIPEPEFVDWGYDISDDPFYDDEPCGLYCGDPQHDHPFADTDPRSVKNAPLPRREQPTPSKHPRRDSVPLPHVYVRTAQQQTTTTLPRHLQVPEMAERRRGRGSSRPANLGLRRPAIG